MDVVFNIASGIRENSYAQLRISGFRRVLPFNADKKSGNNMKFLVC